jgi:hypothetical protein
MTVNLLGIACHRLNENSTPKNLYNPAVSVAAGAKNGNMSEQLVAAAVSPDKPKKLHDQTRDVLRRKPNRPEGSRLVRWLRRVRFRFLAFEDAIEEPDNETVRQQNESGHGQ